MYMFKNIEFIGGLWTLQYDCRAQTWADSTISHHPVLQYRVLRTSLYGRNIFYFPFIRLRSTLTWRGDIILLTPRRSYLLYGGKFSISFFIHSLLQIFKLCVTENLLFWIFQERFFIERKKNPNLVNRYVIVTTRLWFY